MKHRHLLLSVLCLFLYAGFLPAQPLDQYGGFKDLPAPGGATGFFRVAKAGNRWMLVTPDGNQFWMMGMFNVGLPNVQARDAKYGGAPQWARQTMQRLKSWGFNTVCEYSNANMLPTRTDKMPFVAMSRPSFYGLSNRWGLATDAFHDMIDAQAGGNYNAYAGGQLPDVFDPNWEAYVEAYVVHQMLKGPFWGGTVGGPWNIGITMDEGDNMYGFGPGAEIKADRLHAHIGYFSAAANPTLITSRRQRGPDGQAALAFSDPTVYSKIAVRDFLAARYDTIDALNAAWGSTYTSWGSDGAWGAGSGFLDESGRGAWFGSRDRSLTGANATLVKDMDDFLFEWANRYFSVQASKLKKYLPKTLVMTPASQNFWGGLTRSQILRAAGQNADVINAMVGSQQVLDLTARYTGDKPIVAWEGFAANPDSALYQRPNPVTSVYIQGFPTQADRGANYEKRMQFLTGATTATGSKPIVGFKFWAYVDSPGEGVNWGLVTVRDNTYDGKEARIAAGKDQWGFSTGGEDRDYGDFISSVVKANATVFAAIQK